ncbi:MAG TPA: hypothetical protein IAB65_04500 [Candidatus Onthocola stercorigallinarum]|nr:hypothetical protein [Candidatus Onthocola stercorigallinarum]
MFVNLDIETLKAISREIDSTNSTLVGSLYPQVRNALVSINENIKTSGLTALLNSCVDVIDETSQTLGKNITNLNAFLDSQMRAYQQTLEEMVGNIRTSVNHMEELISQMSGVNKLGVNTTRLGSVYQTLASNGGI